VIRNILWDVDGTLFDTYPAMTYAVSRALNELGLSVPLNVIDGLARQSLEHCFTALAQRHQLDPDLLRERYHAAYAQLPPANQLPLPGVAEACAWIHARGGLNVAVTHRSVASTQALLDVHGLAPLFAGIVSVAQGYPRKPDPAMVLAALERFGLDPAETLMVGDRALDIEAGQAAGMRTCLYGRAQLAAPADLQVDDYGQLVTLLQVALRT